MGDRSSSYLGQQAGAFDYDAIAVVQAIDDGDVAGIQGLMAHAADDEALGPDMHPHRRLASADFCQRRARD
jgi:hypothetical protein